MAPSLPNLLRQIADKAARLADNQRSLLSKIESLETEIADLRAQLDDAEKQLTAARSDAEFLTLSHRLADNPDSIILARRRIARLIRTIDKCISQLREQ